jgi:hypothetical protein
MRPTRSTRRLALTVSALTAISALACTEAPTDSPRLYDFEASLAKGGGGGGGGTPATVDIVSLSPGLLPDGAGVYAITIPSGGVMEVRPTCSSGRTLNLQGMGAAFDAFGNRSTCNGNAGAGFMFLKPLVNLTTPAGACPGQNAPAQSGNGWNFGVTNRYFFQVDGSDADTKFDDEQYTLVLTHCDVSIPVGQPTWRRVVATTGDLYTGQTGTPLAGYTGLSVNIDVTLKP